MAGIRRLAAVVCIVLGSAGSAAAQTALDGFDPGANGVVLSIAIQADGKILIGGGFTMIGGGTGHTARNYVARLNVDGSVDSTFDPGADNWVDCIRVQPDGKILVGGLFTMLGGGGTGTNPRAQIGRLNANGTIDGTFNPGATGEVDAIAVQADHKILVGGLFSNLGGSARKRIGRLNENGTLDGSFDPGADNGVYALQEQADGKILVGGLFTMLGGGGNGTNPRNRIGRLTAAGLIDGTFDPNANGGVFALAVQPDAKILVGGEFNALAGGSGSLLRLNFDGSRDTGFAPNVVGIVKTIALQPDGNIAVGGDVSSVGGVDRSKIGRVNFSGSLDSTFNPGANNRVETLAVQSDGSIVVGGQITMLGGGGSGTTTRNRIGRLYAGGWLDADFDPGSDAGVVASAIQPDGNILIGGPFAMIGGGSGNTLRNRGGRLNPDGTVDGFDPNVVGSYVYSVAPQSDRKVLLGGEISAVGGVERDRIGRVDSTGSLDLAFDPGANGAIPNIVVQPDRKILVGGNFTTLGGGGLGTTPRHRLGRVDADGVLDTNFDPGANNNVQTLAVQPDGKILVGGIFTMLGGGGSGTTQRLYFGRLNPNGSLDDSFDVEANNGVHAIAVQPDGKIVVGGFFTQLRGTGGVLTQRLRIGRFNPDGSLDGLFDPGAVAPSAATVESVVLQTDGKIVVAGYFTGLGGGTGTIPRHYIGRLNSDGSVDSTFDPGADSSLYGVTVQPDGKIVAGGLFEHLGGGSCCIGTPRLRIGRLPTIDAAIQSLSATHDTVTWTRTGSSPEVWNVVVESSADGSTYTSLGNAVRINGGWQLSGQSLAWNRNLFIRARGAYQTGWWNGSASIAESVRNVYFPAAPTVVTGTASSIGPFAATLNGAGNPNNLATTGSFEYGLTTGYGSTTPGQSLGSGDVAVAIVGGSLTDLACNTLYHFRATATNSVGTATGQDATFTTGACPAPIVTTGVASAITATTATLNGMATPNGTAATGSFHYGVTISYGGTTPGQALGSGFVALAIGGGALTGLTCNTLYHFRATATNTGGTTNGLDATFRTLSCPGSDFDGDGKTDRTVFRPSTAAWYTALSNGGATATTWGVSTDVDVAGDYDGDGKLDVAVFRPSNGLWFIVQSSDHAVRVAGWGINGDVPMAGDVDGDGKADLIVFRPASGVWFFNKSGGGTSALGWGVNGDQPLVGDFDGDGKMDATIYRPTTGVWYSALSGGGTAIVGWGTAGDLPVIGDWDGDRIGDPAIFRPSTGQWFVKKSTGGILTVSWGVSGDVPVTGDWDGDAKSDFTVWRPASGVWFTQYAIGGSVVVGWGVNGDKPAGRAPGS